MTQQNLLLESNGKSFKAPQNSLIAWEVNLVFVYRQLHNLNAIQQVLTFEERKLFHAIHIILPILRQFITFGAHRGYIEICNKKFAFSFISITLLYYYFINSGYLSSNEKFNGNAFNKVSFRIVSTAFFTQVSL